MARRVLEAMRRRKDSPRGRGAARAGLALAACLAGAAPLQAAEPTVILLSWDGTRHDFPERAQTPALDRMAREGVRAARLVPVFPSNTFPNHVSLATGASPDVHGIVGNIFLDDARGRFDYSNDASWIEAEPLWAAAERQGVRAAAFFWVGSETDWRGAGASYRRVPFDSGVGEAEKVDQILAWLDLPEAERPRLILAWWHGCDHVGHARGPDDPEIGRQLARQDAQLARLLAGLDARGAWPRTTLLVVSDHGMAAASRQVDVAALLARRGIRARVSPGGATAFLRLDDPARRAAALEVLRGHAGLRAWPSEAPPEGFRAHFPGRTGDLTVLADPPLLLEAAREGGLGATLRRWLGAPRGAHGYDPSLPEMGAIFYAMGRGVPADLELGAVSALDVAPTASRLLGIDPPARSEGHPIPGIGP